MANSILGTSYAAQSLGLTPTSTGAGDVTRILQNELAEQAKKRVRRPGQMGADQQQSFSPAAFDLLGLSRNGR